MPNRTSRHLPLGVSCPHLSDVVVATLDSDGENDTISFGTAAASAAHCLASLGPRVVPATEPIIYEGIVNRTPAAMQKVEEFVSRHDLDMESLLRALHEAVRLDTREPVT